MIARQQGRGLGGVAQGAGADVLSGSSQKAALDLDWDDRAERERALVLILATLEAVETYAGEQVVHDKTTETIAASLATARQVQAQDVTTSEHGQPVGGPTPPCCLRERAARPWDSLPAHRPKARPPDWPHRLSGHTFRRVGPGRP